ncbi:MAG: hypothetical protein ACREMB_08935 [Candidatus Rokuibacteriota bacterium]
MIALLTILAAGLVIGKLAHRMTPAVELLLLLLVSGVVLAEFLSWGPDGAGLNPLDLVQGLLSLP